MYKYQYTQLHLGVQVRIVVFAEKEEKAKTAVKAAFNRFATLEDVFSNYRATSEVSRLTSTTYNKFNKVSNELFSVLESSIAFSNETHGAFDITLGPLIELWRNARKQQVLPDHVSLASAFDRAGWQKVMLNAEDQTVKLMAEQMMLDMGGIAKGFIVDEAMSVLRQHGIDRALIEAGGEILVSGPPPDKPGWFIEVPGANTDSRIAQTARTLKNAAIATSGDTEQFVTIDGLRYSHIIDPLTGLGNTSRRMATVIAPNGETADKFATALTLMDSLSAEQLIRSHPEVIAFTRVAKD
ncbi:MAG: FAD:protein FMN transferase [Rhodothermales bacterium]